jgi:hypothetical protein
MYTRTYGSAHPRACPISTRIVSNLCNALQFLMRRRIFNPAWMLLSVEHYEAAVRLAWRSVFRLGRVHGGLGDGLTHLAGLLCQRAHLTLHILAVQPHHLGQILGFQQRLRVVE